MSTNIISEKSRLPITVKFFDDAFDAVAPETLRYRIDCLTNKVGILGWTVIAPGSVVEIDVAPSQNAIINTKNSRELKSLVVEVEYGTDNAYTDNYNWLVKNQFGIT